MAKSHAENTQQGVAVVEQSAHDLPAHLQDMGQDVAGLGNSDDMRDSSMPFMAIIQKNSPQVDRNDPKYIPDAKEGFILNTATSQIWGEDGVVVIPCGYQKNFVEWKPNRGGWAGSHPFDVQAIKKLGAKKETIKVDGKDRQAIILPSGNILTETAYTFLVVDGTPMILGASSTALGPMRDWMSYRKAQKLPNGMQMPSFAKQYRLKTVYNKNDSGSWYNWRSHDEGFVVQRDVYEACRDFAKKIAAGEVTIGRPDDWDQPAPGDQGDGDDRSVEGI